MPAKGACDGLSRRTDVERWFQCIVLLEESDRSCMTKRP